MRCDTHSVANSTAEWVRMSFATWGSHPELRWTIQRTRQSQADDGDIAVLTQIASRRLPRQPKRQLKVRTTKFFISISEKKNTIIRSSIKGQNAGLSTLKFLIRTVIVPRPIHYKPRRDFFWWWEYGGSWCHKAPSNLTSVRQAPHKNNKLQFKMNDCDDDVILHTKFRLIITPPYVRQRLAGTQYL